MAKISYVLVVEDTPSILLMYSTLLQRRGYATLEAENAEDAKELFLKHEPKVVLLDLNLPDRDGLELLQEMLLHDPTVKVIVITANGSMNKAVSAMRLGADDFLVKPVADEKLLTSISQATSDSSDLNNLPEQQILDMHVKQMQGSASVKSLIGLSLLEVERAFIEATIESCDGSLPKAAKILGVAPSTIYRKREQWEKAAQ